MGSRCGQQDNRGGQIQQEEVDDLTWSRKHTLDGARLERTLARDHKLKLIRRYQANELPLGDGDLYKETVQNPM